MRKFGLAGVVPVIVIALALGAYLSYALPTSTGNPVTVGSVRFSNSWHYVENVTLSGAQSACEIMRAPCVENPSNSAMEFSDGASTAYIETFGLNSVEYTLVLIDGQPYCVSPNFELQPECPSTIGAASNTVSVTSVNCVQTGPSQQVYAEIVSDNASNAPIEGASVYGSLAINCGGEVVNYPLQTETTPNNGTVPLNVEGCSCSIGNYSIIITNGSSSYQVESSPPIEHLGQIVVLTIGIPSERVIDMHITNSGVCMENSTTVTNSTGFFC